MNDDDIKFENKEAFQRQTIIGWKNIFMGKFAKGWRKFWIERQQWATEFAILMMKWGLACWTSRNGTLYGEKPKIYAITRKRLMVEAKMWQTATMMERLIGDAHIQMKKKTLKTAASITIATWLDEMQELSQKKTQANNKYNTKLRNNRGAPRSRRTI